MLRRLILATMAVVALAAIAGAATIDPELQAVMAQKTSAELVPVLMIFDQPFDFSAIQTSDPVQRRGQVISALKTHAETVTRTAMATLTAGPGTAAAEDVTLLYLANAISFKGNAAMIEALASDRSPGAVLLYDRSRTLLEMTDARQASLVSQPETKQDRADTVWNVKWINADHVWNQLGYTGTGVIVGHLDSGVWLTHPDLASRIYVNPGEIPGNGIDDDNNGYIDDYRGWDFGDSDNNPNDDNADGGHGTHTAGTVCGTGAGGTQTGVAPGAKLLACKVFDSAGSGTVGMIWEGEQYAVAMGARVLTMSLGVKGSDLAASLLRADRANNNAIREAGTILFNSAGNYRAEFEPPYELGMTARTPAPWNDSGAVPYSSTGGVMAVGGTGYQSNLTYSESSRGPATWSYVDPYNDWPYNPGAGLTKPDICAPAVNVNSTLRYGGYSGNTWSGTSMSCPHLAGVAALMLQKNPTLSPAGIDSVIEQTALDLGALGKDNVFGAGLVNAYTAVLNTPTTQMANIVETEMFVDPAGDGIVDVGQITPFAFALKNVSTLINATNVQGTLTIPHNLYVTVTDGSATFPNLAANGGTGDNLDNPFQISVIAGTPQGFAFTMMLTVTCDGGFTQTFDVETFAGLPDFLTHDVGNVFGTVTDQGIIGYLSDDQTQGRGFGLAGAGSDLFVGSFWAGNSTTYICNRDYAGAGAGLETFEWVTRHSPTGRMRDLGNAGSDQTFAAAFTDSGHATPRRVSVEQTSFAWAGSPDDKFVILEYHMTNNGTTPMLTFWTGVFCDLDVPDGATNIGSVDVPRHAIYLHPSAGGPYVGLTLVSDSPAANVSFINNPTYVYPNSAIDNGNKLRFLRGLISVHDTTGPDDWSIICSTGSFSFPVGAEITVAYAMVYGATLEEFLNNCDAAKAAYNPLTPVTDALPVKMFRLGQNSPNPFNPMTSLEYEVAAPGRVSLAVYDVSGKLVRTLVDEARTAGRHEVVWDGTDDSGQRVASGVYFAKYFAGDQVQTRKMTMVK